MTLYIELIAFISADSWSVGFGMTCLWLKNTKKRLITIDGKYRMEFIASIYERKTSDETGTFRKDVEILTKTHAF